VEPCDLLAQEEGFEPHAYPDHLGYWTIGYGRCIDKRRGKGISQEEGIHLLHGDLNEAIHWLEIKVPTWRELSLSRQAILISMYHQLGPANLGDFRRLFGALACLDFKTVFLEMLDSKWAKEDTPGRARRQAYAFLKDESVPPQGIPVHF